MNLEEIVNDILEIKAKLKALNLILSYLSAINTALFVGVFGIVIKLYL